MADTLLDIMARSLRIPREPDESDAHFACRVSYSALRFWMQAYCIDDGYGGAVGLSRDSVLRKAAQWIRSVGFVYPQVPEHIDDNDLGEYLDDLLAIGDLVESGEGLLRCTRAHRVQVRPGITARLGLDDPQTRTHGDLFGAIVLEGDADRASIETVLYGLLLDEGQDPVDTAWGRLCTWPSFSGL